MNIATEVVAKTSQRATLPIFLWHLSSVCFKIRPK